MEQIVLGNMISFAAAVMLFLGCYTTDTMKVYRYQIAENLILCLSSFVFGSYSGMITLSLAIFRNMLLMKNKYTRTWMIVLSIMITAGGVLMNTKGAAGLLPVIATLVWTVSNYYYQDFIHVKIFLLVNISLWTVYFFAIWDFSSGIAQIVTGMIGVLSIYRVSRKTYGHSKA